MNRLALVIRRMPMSSIRRWWPQVWQLYLRQPGVFILQLLVLQVTSLIGAAHPILFALSCFVTPFLLAGFYRTALLGLAGKTSRVSDIFVLFSDQSLRQPLFQLGVVNLVLALPQMWLVQQLQTQLMNDPESIELSLLLMAVIWWSLSTMVTAFAAPIVFALRQQLILPVLLASLRACWRNVGVLSAIGALLLLALMLVTTILGLIGVGLGGSLNVVLLLILLVGWPLLMLSYVVAFQDMFVLAPAKPDDDVLEV
jgi:hypothetical protein